MRRLLPAVAAGCMVVALLAGCGPQGQPCKRVNDIKVVDGRGYTCTAGPNGSNTWQ